MTAGGAPERPRRRLGRAALALALLIGVGFSWSRTQGLAAILPDSPDTARGPGAVLIVSAAHPLPADYPAPDLVPLVHEVPVANSGVRVAAEVEQPLRAMFAAARKAGLKRLYVSSGYRTAEEQQELWDNSADRSYVQRPGHSEHQTGLAVDLADLKVGDGKFGESKAGRWLAANSWRHGFVLRYPSGKEAITGIAYEPWHFRYVGKDVAKECHDGDLTLEEYVAAG